MGGSLACGGRRGGIGWFWHWESEGQRTGRAYVCVPFQLLLWKVVLFGVLLEVFDELGEDGFEVLELVGRGSEGGFCFSILELSLVEAFILDSLLQFV